MSRTETEKAVTELLQRLAAYAPTKPSLAHEPLAIEHRRRRPTWTMAAAAVLLVAALASVSLLLGPDRDRPVSTIGEPAALPGGTTERLAATELTGRTGAASVWTGKELLVWGGSGRLGSDAPLADGAALDPVANRWRPLPAAPIGPRRDPAAVWTGTEMVVWGGFASDRLLIDGAAFDPRTNHWRIIATQPFGGALQPAVVWTGSEMVVFSSMNVPTAGSAYDPATNRWRRLTPPPGRLLIPVQRVAWTGREAILLLWPEVASNGPNSDMFLASYAPDSDQWSRLPEVDLEDGFVPPLVWTGREVLVLQSGRPGHAFDPGRQVWRSLASGSDDPPAFAASPVWTGRQVLLWAGGEQGLAYDPELDRWSPFDAGGLERRSDAVVAWTGGLFVGWGGGDGNADGVRYRPPS